MAKKINFIPHHIIFNFLIALLCYSICRLAFLMENWSFYSEMTTWNSFCRFMEGGLIFDTSAICFTNSLYLLLALLPFLRKSLLYNSITKWCYILPNVIAVIINLMDSVFFSFTKHRVTADVFKEFQNENNLAKIIGTEALSHWYLFVLAFLLTTILWFGYRRVPQLLPNQKRKSYFILHIGWLIIFIPLAICGMRGAFFHKSTRPITISNAFLYVDQPAETHIVLNTPFALIKTVKHQQVGVPKYFDNNKELYSIFSPVHYPKSGVKQRKKNVVILIVESFAQEFVGARNKHLDNGTYKGYTPFVDSLFTQSLTWRETFCNTWISIDAMPAVLASIPKMHDSFVLSPYSTNHINSLATELGSWGYQTAFFHGADNQSMGFQAFARAAGYKDYYGREEFEADPRFNGHEEYDGTWGIWDEPFLQYFCQKMSDMQQPFLASVFTLSSHHPFAIPKKYRETFKDEGKYKLHKCIRYTDHALMKFFASAALQPWYKNTIFVICADHASSKTTHEEYKTELGHFRVPIIFFDPSGELPRGCMDGIAQQIDIMPTLLGYLGYDKPYIAFGKDLLCTEPKDTWAMNWQQIPQFIKGDYLLQFDGEKTLGFFNYRKDPLLTTNLKGKTNEESVMTKELEAVMQCFFQIMNEDKATIK